MFYGKFVVEGDNLMNNPNIYKCRGRQHVVTWSTTLDNQMCVENPFFPTPIP